jgi:proteic killer suppression protein
MIRSFRHKQLQRFFETGDTRGINAQHAAKLRRLLTAVNMATGPRDLNHPSYRLHPLHGEREGQWAAWVSGNWRLVFRFENADAVDVDLVDYH